MSATRRYRARVALGIAVLAAGYHLVSDLRYRATGQSSLLQRLELDVLDLELASRARRAPEAWGVSVAAADERAISELGPLPWSRSVYAELVERLGAIGASAVAFDVTFDRPAEFGPRPRLRDALAELQCLEGLEPELSAWLSERPDDRLARALRSNGRVVLGTVALSSAEAKAVELSLGDALDRARESAVSGLTEPVGDGLTVEHPAAGTFEEALLSRFAGLAAPTATLAASAAGVGVLNATPDDDGVNRGLPVVVAFAGQDRVLPGLAVEAVRVAQGARVELFGEVGGVSLDAIRVGSAGGPLGLGARWDLDWYGSFANSGMPVVSIADVLAGRPSTQGLAGKIVFVAATAIGTYDQRVTPLDRAGPGVHLHATLAQNLLDHRALSRPAAMVLFEVLAMLAFGALAGGLARGLGVMGQLGVGLAGAALWLALDRWLAVEMGIIVHGLLPAAQLLSTVLALALLGFVSERRERRRTRAAFGRYLSPRVLDHVLSDPERHLRLGGHRREASVLFSDIRGFTSISERLDPETLGRLLNLYLTPMTEVVFRKDGTLDKYIGDAIMAIWGAPLPMEAHAQMACEAALGMLEALQRLNVELETEGLPRLSIGIGISSGEMTIGNMGSDDFFAYTAVGDRVNLGARLEGQTKVYGVSIIVCERTYRAATDALRFRELDLVRVKGKQEPERIFELVGARAGTEQRAPSIAAFEAGLEAFRARRFTEAAQGFHAVLEQTPGDLAAQMYLEQSRLLSEQPPPDDWDGVRVATSK